MDFNEYLDKLSKNFNKSEDALASAMTLPSFTTASTDSRLGFESKNFISAEKTSEEMLKEIRIGLKVVKESDQFVRNLAESQTQMKIMQNYSKSFVLRLPKFKFNYQKLPVVKVFNSRRNDLSHEVCAIRNMRRRKVLGGFILSEADENIDTVIKHFENLNIIFRPSGKRVSIHSIGSSSANFQDQVIRTRNLSLLNPVLCEIIESESSSSSGSEEIILPKHYLARQSLYKPMPMPALCRCEGKAEGLSKADYKLKSSKSKSTASQISNKKVLKSGYLTKRQAKTNKFHLRWVVLTGFKLLWYWTHNSGFTKGKVSLTSTLLSQSEAGKERCLLLHGQERVFEFLNEKVGSEWKSIINSQISFKAYLDEFSSTLPEFIEFFQDLDVQKFKLRDLGLVLDQEETRKAFKIFSSSLPAHDKLQVLEIIDSGLTDADVAELCAAIKGNCHIKTLDLSKNFLTSAAVASIADIIKQEEAEFNTIMNINLADNVIKDEGVEILAGALNVRFEQLFFPINLHQTPFYSLNLNNISMDDRGLSALNKVFIKTTKLVQDEEIELKLSLKIAKNHFTSSSFLNFAENLAQFQGIRELDISYCGNLKDDDVVHLVDALGSNFSLTELDLSGVKLTRSGFETLFTLFNQNYSLRNIKVLINDEFKIAVVEKGSIMKHFFIS